MKSLRTSVLVASALLLGTALGLAGDLDPIRPDSGFAWLGGADDVPHEVERDRVKRGLPGGKDPRDIIRPIDEPEFYASVAAAELALGLQAEERVLSLEMGGVVRAYPTRILDRHEVVNDTLAGRPVGVIW